jgi:hypothetical protein
MIWMLLAALAQEPVALPPTDRVRLAEVFRLAARVRDRVWPGWGATPMPILLVTDSVEYYIAPGRAGSGFQPGPYDTLLQREVSVRPRTLDPAMAATFPAVGGVPTVVIGSAERLGKSSPSWVLTVFHEHFHQMQYGQPGYYPGVARLGLSGGDSTGRWMLDYPFPYDSAPVQDAVHRLARSLAQALAGPETSAGALEGVRTAREAVGAALSPADARYLDFQLWQEGVPRYIELAVAREEKSYAAEAERARRTLLAELEGMSLGRDRRVSFYPLGAALALVLERTTPGWKARYFERPFAL